ncbi:hypothetical protein [Escherichia coli]|uniref:hypothetical protein n=1 Tax=Escherichia coli TaxID=562 RepID=UPI003DA8BE3B
MGSLIRKVAKYLVDHWNQLSSGVQWAIKQIAGSALVQAIEAGVEATVNYLSQFGSWAINKIANILGIS